MAHYAIYGSTKLIREYCRTCRRYALVIDSQIQCCGRSLDNQEPIASKQMIAGEEKRKLPSQKEKKRILCQQENKCLYCGIEFGSFIIRKGKPCQMNVVWDHVDPFSRSLNNHAENYVASCRLCNAWKYDKIFRSLEEIKQYVGTKWAKEKEREKAQEMCLSAVQ